MYLVHANEPAQIRHKLVRHVILVRNPGYHLKGQCEVFRQRRNVTAERRCHNVTGNVETIVSSSVAVLGEIRNLGMLHIV